MESVYFENVSPNKSNDIFSNSYIVVLRVLATSAEVLYNAGFSLISLIIFLTFLFESEVLILQNQKPMKMICETNLFIWMIKIKKPLV